MNEAQAPQCDVFNDKMVKLKTIEHSQHIQLARGGNEKVYLCTVLILSSLDLICP